MKVKGQNKALHAFSLQMYSGLAVCWLCFWGACGHKELFSVEHSCIAGALRWTVWLCYNYYTFLIMQLVSNSHRGQN